MTTRLPILGQRSYEQATQAYSTWGGKLLQHTGVLRRIQEEREFTPITVQLAPTERCSSHCPFCSVENRPKRGKIPWDSLVRLLGDFANLGAKSVELTGGGDPLLYRDGSRTIDDIVDMAVDMGMKVGIITDTERPSRHLSPESMERLAWLRVSLIKLDEGKEPEDYDFAGLDGKIGLSYIIYDATADHVGTTPETIARIARVVELNPSVKFVRIAPNCLNDDALTIKSKWGDVVAAVDAHSKFFIKEINEDYHAFDGGCWVGMLRPYVTSTGVYICTSHTLIHRGYHPTWKLCGYDEIAEAWPRMNARFKAGLPPYEIDVRGECRHCYYGQSNRILHYVTTTLPDRDFA